MPNKANPYFKHFDLTDWSLPDTDEAIEQVKGEFTSALSEAAEHILFHVVSPMAEKAAAEALDWLFKEDLWVTVSCKAGQQTRICIFTLNAGRDFDGGSLSDAVKEFVGTCDDVDVISSMLDDFEEMKIVLEAAREVLK